MITFEGKTFIDEKQVLNALAFCHYPVTISSNGVERTFSSFDEARQWIEEQFKNN